MTSRIELLTQKEAAALLRVDRTTLLRWQKEHHVLPEMKMSGRHVYDRRDVEAFLSRLEAHGWPKRGRRLERSFERVAA